MAEILIETSARHAHVTKEVLEVLFGAGHELTPKKDLSQPGQYACEEKVEVTTADTSNMIKKMVDEYGKNSGVTEEKLKEYYGEYYFENILVSEKAVEILKKYADIK